MTMSVIAEATSLIVRVGVVNFFGRKQALVEHDHAAVGPFNRLSDIHRSREEYCSEGWRPRRVAPPALPRDQGLVGILVNPCVPMMVVTAIIEL